LIFLIIFIYFQEISSQSFSWEWNQPYPVGTILAVNPEDGSIYFGSGSDLICYNSQGSITWSYDTNDIIEFMEYKAPFIVFSTTNTYGAVNTGGQLIWSSSISTCGENCEMIAISLISPVISTVRAYQDGQNFVNLFMNAYSIADGTQVLNNISLGQYSDLSNLGAEFVPPTFAFSEKGPIYVFSLEVTSYWSAILNIMMIDFDGTIQFYPAVFDGIFINLRLVTMFHDSLNDTLAVFSMVTSGDTYWTISYSLVYNITSWGNGVHMQDCLPTSKMNVFFCTEGNDAIYTIDMFTGQFLWYTTVYGTLSYGSYFINDDVLYFISNFDVKFGVTMLDVFTGIQQNTYYYGATDPFTGGFINSPFYSKMNQIVAYGLNSTNPNFGIASSFGVQSINAN